MRSRPWAPPCIIHPIHAIHAIHANRSAVIVVITTIIIHLHFTGVFDAFSDYLRFAAAEVVAHSFEGACMQHARVR